MRWFTKHPVQIVILFTLLSAILHFYNLNWGAPYYFHPDERNIAYSISQLTFPDQMNPKFFAYGSLPIYAVYFTGIMMNALTHANPSQMMQVTFEQAIIISRSFSALFATILIPLLYLIGKKVHTSTTGILASFFGLTSVGMLQFSHFGTFELWLTLFGTILLLICLELTTKPTALKYSLAALVTGILIATKVTSLALAPLPLLAVVLTLPYKQFLRHKLIRIRSVTKFIALNILFCCIAGLVYIATNPYSLTDNESFQNSMRYESGVALGTLPVFYTQEFYKAPPGLFQLLRIYPFLLNPLLTLLLLPALGFIAIQSIRTKSRQGVLLLLFTLILFCSQAFLFVKWTRYMVPTIPLIYITVAITLVSLAKHMKKTPAAYIFSLVTLIGLCLLYATAYVIVVLASPDTRVTARNWARMYIPRTNPAVSEIYDLGILPFNEIFDHITLCNFYDVESNPTPCDGQSIDVKLAGTQTIILPSQRIYKTRFTNPMRYPQGAIFYRSLFSGKLGYHKVYETPCNVLCRILYLGNPVYSLEQTATVFDRPTITILTK